MQFAAIPTSRRPTSTYYCTREESTHLSGDGGSMGRRRRAARAPKLGRGRGLGLRLAHDLRVHALNLHQADVVRRILRLRGPPSNPRAKQPNPRSPPALPQPPRSAPPSTRQCWRYIHLDIHFLHQQITPTTTATFQPRTPGILALPKAYIPRCRTRSCSKLWRFWFGL